MGKFGGKNRRINILSYPAAQIRMVLIFAVLGFIYASVNFYVSRQALGKFKDLMRSEVTSPDDLINVDIVFKQTAKNLDIQLGLLTLLCFVMLCLGSLVVSHRVAGPIYHLRKYMSGILDGSVKPRQVKFRKDDFFHELAVVFNGFQNRLMKDEPGSAAPPAGDVKDAG